MQKIIEDFINKTNIFKSVLWALLITNTLTFIILKLTINTSFLRAITINSLGTVAGVVLGLLPAQILYKQLIIQRMNLLTYYNTDALTGLLSRKPLLDKIQQYLDNSKDDSTNAFIMVDIDHFKLVNDNYGHLAGDVVLSYIGRILLNSVDDNCIVGRFGGEEFIVYLNNTSEKVCIEEINKLKEKLETSYVYKGQKIDLTSSFGCVINSCMDIDIITLIQESDKKLFLAKENGRNRIEYQYLTKEGTNYAT
jgi:diguanylate cyclase (GGDEF)-like protein